MTEKEKYALEWNNSAQYFYDHRSYKHLTVHIRKFETVLEIGCGTGQSTLALLEAGHRVIALDQNANCIEMAKKMVEAAGYEIKDSADDLDPKSVCFIEIDVTSPEFEINVLPNISPDIVICWNVGSYWDKEKLEDAVPKMLEYGLSVEQISANTESSYGELILWRTCAIAKAKACAVHIVDRSMQKITKFNDPYYSFLKKELGFRTIKYSNLKASALSKGGRQLIANGKVRTQNEIPIIFVSILMT
jgi:SAM-dependent methyltransferase